MLNQPFARIDTHSPANYLANQAANPFGVIFHDLPDHIKIEVADSVLSDAAFPSRELQPDVVKHLEGVFTQEGVCAALRKEAVPHASFSYSNQQSGEFTRLDFSVVAEISGDDLLIHIDNKK